MVNGLKLFSGIWVHGYGAVSVGCRFVEVAAELVFEMTGEKLLRWW